MRSFWLLVIFGTMSSVIGWPDAEKYPDCNSEKIVYLMNRACAMSKRNSQHWLAEESEAIIRRLETFGKSISVFQSLIEIHLKLINSFIFC